MNDVIFFLKTFVLTVAIVLVMQIEVGHRSIEGHAMSWVQSSAIVSPLNTVARSAGKMVHDGFDSISKAVKSKFSKKKKEER